MVGSREVASKGYVKTDNSQMAFVGIIFSSTYHIVGKFGKLTLFEHLAKESLAN